MEMKVLNEIWGKMEKGGKEGLRKWKGISGEEDLRNGIVGKNGVLWGLKVDGMENEMGGVLLD